MPRQQKLAVAIASATALFWCFAACAQTSLLETVKQRGVVVVGTRDDYPPLSYIDEQGHWVGIEAELSQYIADKLGVKLKQVVVSGATRIPFLVNGNVDFLGSVMPTPERAKIVDFITPFFYDRLVIVTHKAANIRSIQDLAAPRTITTVSGGDTARGVLKAQPKAQFALFPEWPQALQALITGHADGMVAEETSVIGLLKNVPANDLVIGPAFRNDPDAMAVRRNDSRWRLFLDMATMQAWNDGTIPRLYEKYLGRKPPYRIRVWSTIDDLNKPGFWDQK